MPHDPLPDPNPDEPVDLPISPGTTWTDVEGNTWTSYGSLLMSDDSIQSVRQNLIAFLKARHPKWRWYSYPPDVLKTPAVAVNPSDPYILPYTSGGPDAVVWGIDLVIVAERAKPQQALRRLEYFFTEIQISLKDYPSVRWLQVSDVGTTEIGGVEHLTAVMSLAVIAKLTGTT